MTDTPLRILVIETLYLGDLIHTLPLIQALRSRYPQAALDVLVRRPHVELMQQLPGLRQVLAMDPKQHRGVGGLLSLCGMLRAEHYDLVLNPGASDRATILTALSGGRQRIGRLNRQQSKRLWPLLHDQVIDYPWAAEPMYWQKLNAFRPALKLDATPRFGLDCSHIELPQLLGEGPIIHLSPCASEDLRCIPPATMVELLTRLHASFPRHRLMLSCGPAERERNRLEIIRQALPDLPVQYLPGNLSLVQLAALIQRSALHIGPDSGPLHLAVALDRPALACFLFKNASAEWIPVGVQYRTHGVHQKHLGGLYGLSARQLVESAAELLRA
ncbi:MAG: glycosyltransferase family 9 protein [Pseudomonadota bacterium]